MVAVGRGRSALLAVIVVVAADSRMSCCGPYQCIALWVSANASVRVQYAVFTARRHAFVVLIAPASHSPARRTSVFCGWNLGLGLGVRV